MISFSGVDCCGKSTQIQKICAELDKQNKKYGVIWSRGGYTPGIEFIKKIIRRGKTEPREKRVAESVKVQSNSKMRRILFVASLIDLWLFYTISLRIKGIGKTVICDRSSWDTYIDFKMKYPEYDFENGFWWKLTLKTMVKPKPSFCLFIPAEMSMYRSTLKDEPFPESIEVRQERIDWYMREQKNKRWQYEIDATKSIDEVYAQIRSRITI